MVGGFDGIGDEINDIRNKSTNIDNTAVDKDGICDQFTAIYVHGFNGVGGVMILVIGYNGGHKFNGIDGQGFNVIGDWFNSMVIGVMQ